MSVTAQTGWTGEAEVRRLRALYQLVSNLSRAASLNEVYDAAIASLLAATEADRASILIFDPDGVMRFKAWRDLSESYRAAITGHTPWAQGTLDAQPVLVPDAFADPGLAAYHELFLREGIGALAFIPLALDRGVFGKFMLYYAQPHELTTDELDAAEAIATHVALAAERKQSELARAQSENRLQAILDNSAAVVYLKDLQGRYVLTNRLHEELFHLPKGRAIGRTDFELFPPDIAARFVENDRRVLAAGRSFAMEEYAPQDDGLHSYISVKFPIREPDGAISGICGISTDITERKRAEATARNLAAIVENSWEAIVGTDATGVITSWNAGAERVFGYTAAEAVGQSIVALLAMGDGSDCRNMLQRVAGGESVQNYETQRRRKDGRTLDILLTVSPVRDAAGQVVGVSGIARDVTESRLAAENLRRSNEALRESEDHYRHTVQLNPQVPWTASPEGKLEDFSPQWLTLTGLTREQALATGWDDVPHPDDLPAMLRAWSESMQTGAMFDLEHRIRVADGSHRWMRTRARPRRSADGRIIRWYGYTEDIDARKRAEQALEENERRFRAFVTTTSEVVCSMSPDWGEIRQLRGAHFVLDNEQSGSGWMEKYIHPDDQSYVRAAIDQAVREKSPVELEHHVIRPDGYLAWMSSRAVPLLDEHGEIVEWLCASRDITARKRAETTMARLTSQAEQQRRLYDTILSNTPDLVYVFDLKHRYTYANKALLSMWGKTWDEAIGKNFLELGYEPWNAAMHDREIEQVINTRQPIRGQVPFTGTQGRRIYDYIFVPVIGADGEVEAIAGTTRDVTDQKLAEDQLREAAERFRFMAESMPQKIFTTTPAGEVDYFNRQCLEFTALNFEQIREHGWAKLIHADDLPETVRTWRRALKTGEPFVFTHRFRRADGAYRWHLSRANAMRGPDGQIQMWIGSSTEIHEQKQREEELRRANRDLEQFAYSASHDLQEPLRSVKIYGELLAARYSDRLDGEALEYLGFLVAGATRMEMLIRDLLTYTQASAMDHTVGELESTEALKAALHNLSEAISESGAEILVDPLPSVAVHQAHLQQLFQNLIGNAIKYRRPGVTPQVRIAAERRNGNWVFSVQDNGIGIEPQYHERIFGLFKRLHTNQEYSGTGIGLALCSRILEHYHGRIWVESTPGSGSTFYFTFPV